MRCLFILLALFLTPVLSAVAFTVEPIAPEEPYQVVDVTKDSQEKQVYIGKLSGYPVMYRLQTDEKIEFNVAVSQPKRGEKGDFVSVMIVRQDDSGGGVTEVARLNYDPADVKLRKDPAYGLTFIDSGEFRGEIVPGIYKIEVSTPDNSGYYWLSLGNNDSESLGYFDTLKQVRAVQQTFGYSIFHMLTSSYVYYPLGIIVLAFIIQRTWRYRKVITNA